LFYKNVQIKYLLVLLFVVLYVILMIYRIELKKNLPEFGIFFLNTMPNLLAGFFCSLAFDGFFFKSKRDNLSISLKLLVIGGWLTLEEYYPILSHNNFFDYYDIVMSWVGVFMAFIILITIRKE
jgi:hypothetical protein